MTVSVYLAIDTSNFDSLAEKLGANLPQLKDRILWKGALIVEDNFRAIMPKRTGHMESTVTAEVSGDSAKIGEHSGYGIFVNEGTRPHIIKGNPLLAFERGGRTIIVRSVRHPGTRGQHFAEKTVSKSQPEIEAMISSELDALLEA